MEQKVYLRQVKGSTLLAKGKSNHWVVLDTKEETGGSNAGSTPKELLLMALAGCTSMDVITILKKKRAPLLGYECIISAEEAHEHPKKYTALHVEYVFYGDGIHPNDVEHAIELSRTKYCSVSAQLEAGVPITHSYRIEPANKLHG
ncbi:MAG: OsmC family protein, partial [Bacteroidetes bacterium]|nr:OsmC family protein [Bacteroidota bacterium]